MLPILQRLQSTATQIGLDLEGITGPANHPRLAIRFVQSPAAPSQSEGYNLHIHARGVTIEYREVGGLRAGTATLRQLMREYGRNLPRVKIRDYPDFPRRGVMLDISRGRVPNLATLCGLVDILADFKINEFQLYTEHTFAYRNYEPVWKSWGALTGEEILHLDQHCRKRGIDLVPNQNCFGHLRYWLEYPPLKPLAEVSAHYEGAGGNFLRYPTTLAPNHPGTMPFLQELFDELLPCFTSKRVNVGCDETWDLGRGQSRSLCRRQGKGRVYLNFVKKIHRQIASRGHQMMFWGDIILHHPELIPELSREVIALNWGYEANHPFAREARQFARSGIPFYVCPGTSTWMTLIGRHDNALQNLKAAAEAGRNQGAIGYLNTDWGDGGHPQPLAVSYLPYLVGATHSWWGEGLTHSRLMRVLNRDLFEDSTEHAAQAAMAMGLAHRKFRYFAPNVTPFGTVIAAPPPPRRELVCRDGLKYYARIPGKNIRDAFEELENQRAALHQSRPESPAAKLLLDELEFASRMALHSCKIMLWQQALATGQLSRAKAMARTGIKELRILDQQFNKYWPTRNKGTPKHCSSFLKWRIQDYQLGRLHFPPEQARLKQVPQNPAD